MRTDLEKIIKLRHDLHRHAELSMQETETKKILMDFLARYARGRLVDRGKWFYYVTGEEKPAEPVAFRADMDALPMEETIELPYASENCGIAHKCGHDGHSAALCALALELDACPVERPVYLIFQPGEETGAGGYACAQFLKEAGIHEVYAFHNLEGYPENSIIFRTGLTQPASEGLILYFTGKQSHASEPEKGINPAELISRTVLYTGEIARKQYEGMVLLTVVGMQAGTGDFGISAGEGSLSITLRAEIEGEMKGLEDDILSFARLLGERCGIRVTHEISDYFPETRNTDAALNKVKKAAQKSGRKLIEMDHLWRASEDFGYYTKVAEGAVFYIGTGEDHAPLHTSGYDFNDHIIPTAVEMLYNLAKSTDAMDKN